MDHGGYDMGPRCSMHMLWNTQVIDTCVVFSQWHIRSHLQFFLSFLAIAGLGVLYEYLRKLSRDFDGHIATKLRAGRRTPLTASARSSPERSDVEETGLLHGLRVVKKQGTTVPPLYRAIRAILYGASVGLSFFLMLVFMTYNAYLILAVVLGAVVGHYVLGEVMEPDSTGGKGMACH
ncbi:Ctr copper transporter [Rhizopogon salebrosus TDB-379]|nr:Ctr copper transporter [Rhizopogon salebrosus TDB-379]